MVAGRPSTTTRVRDLPPVTSGQVGAYLGAPLTDRDGRGHRHALRVRPGRRGSGRSTDVATLRRLADAVVTELELSALVREYEGDRLRWGLAIDAAGIGTFDWDLVTGRLAWDDQLIAMFGYDVDDFDQTIEAFNARLHPDDLPRVTDALQRLHRHLRRVRVGVPGRPSRTARPAGCTPAAGRCAARTAPPTGSSGAAYDTTGERAGAARVTRVLEAMPAGFYSLDREWRFTHVNAEAERLLGPQPRGPARPGALGRLPGGARTASSRTATAPPCAPGKPVAFDAYYPAPLNGWYELRAWPSPDGLSVYFLEVTERRRVQERAERSAQRLAILAQVSAELAGTLDAQSATAHLPRLVVPALADFCIVTVVDPDGRPRDVGSWHGDPAARALLERYAAVRLEAMPAISPVARALLTGEVVREPATAVLDMLPPGEARDLLDAAAPRRRVAVLPLRGRGRTLGLLTLYFRAGSAPSEEDLATAQDVADRAGLALDNARLYGAQQQLAEGLQRSLLTEPPEPDHAEIAVRYLPAAEAARVGGDWYDAFLQPGGTTMLVIGDVVGHDTEAAAAMGQLRGLLRGIATYSDAGPVEVLRGLDASMTTLQTQDAGHRRRRPLRADARRAGARRHPHALGQRRPPAAAGDQPRRQRGRAGHLEGRPAPRRRPGRAAGGSRW